MKTKIKILLSSSKVSETTDKNIKKELEDLKAEIKHLSFNDL
jgi:hypothetical protein